MASIAILDDYQDVALKMADWSGLRQSHEVTVFNKPFKSVDDAARVLQSFEIIGIMRERTAFPRELFEKLPKLRVAFAHGGGSFPATVARIQHGFEMRPDLCAVDNNVPPKKYLGHFWLDSLVHDPVMLQYLVDLIGAEKVALGTDYPFPLGELEPGQLIKSMPWDDARKEMLLSGAALQWLGLDRKRFPALNGAFPS